MSAFKNPELTAIAAASRRLKFKDGLMTFDSRTIDSAGAFLVGELERLDPRLHEPLVSVSWSRDIDLRDRPLPNGEDDGVTWRVPFHVLRQVLDV